MQRVKGSGIATTGVQVTAAAQIQYLALELSYANSVAKKKKRKKKKKKEKKRKKMDGVERGGSFIWKLFYPGI